MLRRARFFVARPRPWSPRIAAVALAMVLPLAACASGTTPSSSAGTAAAPGTPSTVDVVATEYKFDPAAITVGAGRVTLHVKNAGTVEHEFEILKGDETVDEVENLLPGLERDLTVDLAVGEYRFRCALPGHEEQGMKGTLTVH